MIVSRLQGTRYCCSCQEETEHLFIYLNHYLKAGICLNCGERFTNRRNLLEIYLHDFPRRLLSKPERLYRELDKIPLRGKKQFYQGIISRLLRKPAKEAWVLREILRKNIL
ncbi:MAG: hypothetical protein GX335_00320 [Firmicutes bacterium]|nr:hypothetical protein [Bacillota bacterium]